MLYARTLCQIGQITGRSISRLHIVGGGSKGDLLNQLTANATGVTVVAGPAEATACGNVLIQALALGHIKDLSALREVVRTSSSIREFLPGQGAEWTDAYTRFTALTLDTHEFVS